MEHSFRKWTIAILTIFAIASFLSPKPAYSVKLSSTGNDLAAYSYYSLMTTSLIKFYQYMISPAKQNYCPMYPSCSQYAYQAFENYNPLFALAITSDRLMRCGNDSGNYPALEIDHLTRFYDPISPDYDFIMAGRPMSETDVESQSSKQSKIEITRPTLLDIIYPDSLDNYSTIYAFAEYLKNEQDYHGAITEYRRLLFLYPDNINNLKAVLSIIECCYRQGDYNLALRIANDYLNRQPNTPIRHNIFFWAGVINLKLQAFDSANHFFSSYLQSTDDSLKSESAFFKGIANAYLENWDIAINSFDRVESSSPYYPEAIKCKELSSRGQDIKRKNPVVAGMLSVFPGLGYYYCGYKKTAISALVVNSIFILGTYEAFDHDLNTTGSLLAVISLGWYTGNIYGAIKSVDRREHAQKADILLQIGASFKY